MVVGSVALLTSMYSPWYRATSAETFCGFLVEPFGGTSLSNQCGINNATVDAWTFKVTSAVFLLIALSGPLWLYVARRRRVASRSLLDWAALAWGLLAVLAVASRLLWPPPPVGLFSVHYGAVAGLASTVVMSLGIALIALASPDEGTRFRRQTCRRQR